MSVTIPKRSKQYSTLLIFLLVFLTICPNRLNAQDELLKIVEYENIKNQLFIKVPIINGDTIAEYSVDARNNFIDLKKEQNFTQKNSITINVAWLNPINFNISIEDTLITDPVSKVVSDFISGLTGQSGITPIEGLSGSEDFNESLPLVPGGVSPQKFNDPDLALWAKEYFDLLARLKTEVEKIEEKAGEAEKSFEKSVAVYAVAQDAANRLKTNAAKKKAKDAEKAKEKAKAAKEEVRGEADKARKRFEVFESIYPRFKNELSALDNYLATNLAASVTGVFNRLKAIHDPQTIRNGQGHYQTAKANFNTIDGLHKMASSSLAKIERQVGSNLGDFLDRSALDEGFRFYTTAFFEKYISQSKATIAMRSKSLEALKQLFELLDKSVTGQHIVERNNVLFAKLKDVNRERGKISKIEMTLKRYSYANNDLSNKSEKVHSKYVMMFQPYRFLIPQVSVGVFYSSLELKTFEAGDDGNGNSIVEEVSSNNGPVYATNLNFYLNTKNSDLLPFVQIGVDPTKERPFLLAGLGIAIPSSRFSLSGGFAWTWRQSLETLMVNGSAESSAAIKDDIKYTFDEKPRLYIGLQYDF